MQKEQQQTKNTKTCRKESSLDITRMALCWNEMVAFRVVGQDFNSKKSTLVVCPQEPSMPPPKGAHIQV